MQEKLEKSIMKQCWFYMNLKKEEVLKYWKGTQYLNWKKHMLLDIKSYN